MIEENGPPAVSENEATGKTEYKPQAQLDDQMLYKIKVKGHLDEAWSEWFDGLSITYDEDDNTNLTGPIIDQSALHGLLKKVRDLGLLLISVNQVEPKAEAGS